ncbi:MAG TPA: folate-binding protein [Polynucleobacter sp.]|jgi:folate-binding protein YgfZ|nr:MAG: glycine cleavage system protein T [Polynucleobacter sp. 16-46-70]HQR84791.1 folate-binding protein [Polynucleobacter sp.]HQS61630.1 folate-binding protein [Polynucleobacter sp.]HQT21180.1 folate-binding protein [Polynucleobacter sp.]HQT41997.1 folate-binding protein [Polynucleobacter sp.]
MTNSAQIPSSTDASTQGLAPLSEWGLILVEGPDAATLLQSQLSNSVLGLKRTIAGEIAHGHDVRLVGYCNPKGRLLASAWLGLFPQSAESEDRFALFISRDIAATIAKRLSMYVLRSKVKVIDASNDWDLCGAYTSLPLESVQTQQKDSFALQLPSVLATDKSFERTLIAYPKNTIPNSDSDSQCLAYWNTLEILSAIPRIVMATQEQFVPQMINFESVAGVDFKKGCYPGQEIVARSQYRGAVKRRLQLANCENTAQASSMAKPACELFHSSDSNQPCGMVVLAAQDAYDRSRINFQLECKLEALEAGEIHLGSPNGPTLQIESLPYPLIEI